MATKTLTAVEEERLRERLEKRFDEDKKNFRAITRRLVGVVSRDRLHKMLDEEFPVGE